MTMVMGANRITATQFKARCLRLLDEVAETRQPLEITKRGQVVARVATAVEFDAQLATADATLRAADPARVAW